ncbi:MAG: hypothetical protein OMM_00147 [Candidatus Magnetoglobus multicellularis str. Araruama]|uniref:Uncharacterized protein n=1 Tax=Candidatus Magnetoglobus multicellularis str. Araruama TaxID=890399 RepID=A0A1V1PIP9_9BACT|nr:MAG: hypothetical protein OMM_00147 [Candidatus Magnetoglobus multicellularis str. Araruama]
MLWDALIIKPKGDQSMQLIHYQWKIVSLMIFLIVCGCSKSQLGVAYFIRPPSKVSQFRDIQRIQIQQPDIHFSNKLGVDLHQLYQQVIQINFARAFCQNPWYQIELASQKNTLSKTIEYKGYEWVNPIATSTNHEYSHKLYLNVGMIESKTSQSEIQIDATLSILLLDPQGKEVYIRLLEGLSTKETIRSNQSQWENMCMHYRLAKKLFQPAIKAVIDDIYPRKIKHVMSIHDNADIRGRYLLAAKAFPESLAHIAEAIKQKERIYVEQKNNILRQYQQLEKDLVTQSRSDNEDYREKRINLSKQKELEIDHARTKLSGDYNNYGTALEALGFIDQAITYYEKAINADPMNYMARLAFHRLVYFRKTSNKELELIRETTEQSLRSQDEL